MSDDNKRQWVDKFGDYATVPVPEDENRSLMNIFLVYTGVLAVIAAIVGGGALGAKFTIGEMFLVFVGGSAILAVIGGLIAFIGGQSSCSTYVNLRFPFGMWGSWLWGVIMSGIPSGIGWFAVETWLFGVTMNVIFPHSILGNVGLAAIWGGFLMMLTAIYGYRGLSFISYLTVPMFLLLALAGFMVGLSQTGGLGQLLALQPPKEGSFVSGLTEVVGLYIVGAVITMDVGRYAKKAWHASLAWVIQVLVIMPFLLMGGGAMVLATGQGNPIVAMVEAGIGVGALLMALFGFWTTNDNNLYSGALSWSLFVPLEKSKITAIEGIIGTAIAAYVGFQAGLSMTPFTNFISLLGKVLPAIGGVLIADFYIYRWYKGNGLTNRYEQAPGDVFAKINWVGWASAIVATCLGGFYLPGVAAINSLVLGVVIYAVIAIVVDELGYPLGIGEHKIDETGV